MAFIPDPDIDIDVSRPEEPQEQESWVDEGITNADDNPVSLPGNSLPPTEESLQDESDAVAYREELALLTDDSDSDPETFGESVCEDIHSLSENVENLDNLGQVISYLQQLTNDTAASKALVSVIRDANQQFAVVFGTCGQNLEVTQWLLKALNTLFCLNVPSG